MAANKKTAGKVLIIEDEETLSQMYALKFDREGFAVETAPDGLTGLELAKKSKPDIILLDIIMPQLDGFTVLEKIKEDDNLKDIPVIMLTNLGQTEDLKKGEKMGAKDYLVKANCTPQDVVNKVKQYLK